MMLHEMLTGSLPPVVLSRLSQEQWSPPSLDEPWRTMLTQALHLERANRPAKVKQWWQTQVNWGEDPQELEAQERQQEAERQLRREAEERAAEQQAAEERNRRQAQEQAKKEAEQREQQAREAERIRAEAAKLNPPEKVVPTPVVTPFGPKPAGQLNRRGLLLAGLGATGLGGAWLVSQIIRQPWGLQALSPAPFASPSSFSFEVVTVNETGQVVSREQNQARYFTEDLGGGINLEMIAIPAGEFMMGSPAGELERLNDEGPQRRVKIAEFSMGRFVVTQAQWQAVMGNNPSRFKGENHPVEQVSWNDAQAFCKKLSQQTGRTYRLPSEAEWEYACRAGTNTPFHCGPTITPELANYDGTYAYGSGPKGQYRNQTTPVGSFASNGFCLHDMHGNVWEWCLDHWHESYSGAPTDGSAWVEWVESNNSLTKVLRGGSWYDVPRNCRSADRYGDSPENRYGISGFRLVISSP
jgi:formylglycine-generating enzyme required for sulfatase activity